MAKPGRPKGTDEYNADAFLKLLRPSPDHKSTQAVIRLFEQEYGMPTSWNTANKYLQKLLKEGRCQYRREGIYNLWFI